MILFEYNETRGSPYFEDANGDAHVYLAALISFLIVFRTNTSYQLYDKAVSNIATIRANMSNIVNQSFLMVNGNSEAAIIWRCQLARYITLLIITIKKKFHDDERSPLKTHMLTEKEAEALFSCDPEWRHNVISSWIRNLMNDGCDDGLVRVGPLVAKMDDNLSFIRRSLGTCERVRQFPVPFPYAQMVKGAIVIWLTFAPFAYVHDTKWFTPAFNSILGILMFGVEQIGAEIEDPFGKDSNDIRFVPYVKDFEKEIAATLTTLHGRPYHPIYKDYGVDTNPASKDLDGPLLDKKNGTVDVADMKPRYFTGPVYVRHSKPHPGVPQPGFD